MRIHHIISNYSMFMGGAERVVRALHAGLKERNVESYIFGLMQQKDHEVDGAQSLGLKSPYELKAFLGIHQYMLKNVQLEDIVHVHLFPPLIYVSLLSFSRKFKCHFVCTEHSTSNRRRGTILGCILDTVTYSGYERIIAISKGVEQELLNWKPELQEKTRVIFNGVKLSSESKLHREPRKHLKVLSVGNFRLAKNYANALKAVALLKDLDFEYNSAGKGEEQDNLMRLCQELGIELKVRFLGYVEPPHELFASADIFLMPSKWEGFGLAAVESMNASLPLVISNIAGLREIVNSDPPCAVLVDPESPESIADGLERLLISSELRLQLGENAFKRAKKFNIDQMVENYIDLYAEII